jgi:hypothetical protein
MDTAGHQHARPRARRSRKGACAGSLVAETEEAPGAAPHGRVQRQLDAVQHGPQVAARHGE